MWPKFHCILRVLAAIENAFSPPLWKSNEEDDVDSLSIAMKLEKENNLITLATQKGLEWNPSTLEKLKQILPSLTKSQLREWCVGPYSLTLAKPYLEHSKELKISQYSKNKRVLKVEGIASRFTKKTNTKHYTVFIDIPKDGNSEAITTYCLCKSGARTLGGCAHSTAALYKLTCQEEEKNVAPQKGSPLLSVSDFKKMKKKEIKERLGKEEEQRGEIEEKELWKKKKTEKEPDTIPQKRKNNQLIAGKSQGKKKKKQKKKASSLENFL